MNTTDSKIVAMAEEALAARERVPSSVVAELLAIIRRSQQRITDSLDAEVRGRTEPPVRVSAPSRCSAGVGGGEVCHLRYGHDGEHQA